MEWYAFKLLLSLAAIFLVPLACLFILREKISKRAQLVLSLYFPFALFLSYSFGAFAVMYYKVEQVYPEKCELVISLLDEYENRAFVNYDTRILELFFDLLPVTYVLSTQAICEYKLENYDASRHALEKLLSLNHKDLPDQLDIEKFQDLLKKINSQ